MFIFQISLQANLGAKCVLLKTNKTNHQHLYLKPPQSISCGVDFISKYKKWKKLWSLWWQQMKKRYQIKFKYLYGCSVTPFLSFHVISWASVGKYIPQTLLLLSSLLSPCPSVQSRWWQLWLWLCAQGLAALVPIRILPRPLHGFRKCSRHQKNAYVRVTRDNTFYSIYWKFWAQVWTLKEFAHDTVNPSHADFLLPMDITSSTFLVSFTCRIICALLRGEIPEDSGTGSMESCLGLA